MILASLVEDYIFCKKKKIVYFLGSYIVLIILKVCWLEIISKLRLQGVKLKLE